MKRLCASFLPLYESCSYMTGLHRYNTLCPENTYELRPTMLRSSLLCTDIRDKLLANPLLPRLQLFIFCDNKYAIRAANDEIRARSNRSIIRSVQTAFSALRHLLPVSVDWVPAHARVMHNETADNLAKRGANGETSFRS